jgi:hypothetical protein
LILEPSIAADYERVVWVDSDILINAAAPCIAQSVPVEKVGAVDEFTFPTPKKRQAIIRWLAGVCPTQSTSSESAAAQRVHRLVPVD